MKIREEKDLTEALQKARKKLTQTINKARKELN
jgi:hypothetical protein